MRHQARTTSILAHEIDDELVLYDRDRQQAHRLNPLAARVYELNDGRRSVDDIVAALSRDPALAADENIVRLALEQLHKAGLLNNAPPATVDRRDAIKKAAAVAAAIALPVVISIAAPTPAMAASAVCPLDTVPVTTSNGTVCTTLPTLPE